MQQNADEESESGYTSEEVEEEELDLGNTILKEIREETYICLICTAEIGSDDHFWSCQDCYRVYHIDCISSWSLKGSSTDEYGNWKCPACHGTHRKQKFQHKCWCQKTLYPQPNALNPGSCGQSCGSELPECPHKCPLPCHPGPHATCNALGPLLKCKCGKHENQWPCVLTPYVDGWHCEDVCEELLPCEIHKCGKICHDGLCGKCEEFMESTCYCGKTKDMVKCCLKNPKKSYGKTKTDNWIGNFQCSLSSEVTYDCNVHFSTQRCGPRAKKQDHCPLSPDVLRTCPCGQTTVEELQNGQNRTCCTDPVPTCDKICNKKLPCGHTCKWNCHDDGCSKCCELIKMRCQCGFNSFSVPCKFVQDGYRATCTRKCTALLSCRRHRCGKICCAEEAAGLTRERIRKKGIRNNQMNSRTANEAFDVEASHICLQTCNKKLSCGNPDHLCLETCHSGPCRPCLESSNDDLVCNCGQTVVMAPVRCGTTLPPCQHPCVRVQPCGHPPMPHNCHKDSQECPKCTYTVIKDCNCGKKKKSAMCHQTEVFCGERCAKKLNCGHRCLLTCHKGPCICKSICGKTKKYCTHVDREACHFPDPCNNTGVCNEMVKVKCKCGRLTREIPCGAYEKSDSSTGTAMSCDVSCVLKEREEKLKDAFGVAETSKSAALENVPYSIAVLKIASAQQKWCAQVEGIMRNFMESSDRPTMFFKPMRREQRTFVHEMAEAYGLFSESQDPEPKRSVYVAKKSTSGAPDMVLAEAIILYKAHLNKTVKAPLKKALEISEPTAISYNAILVDECLEGVTKEDLDDAVRPEFLRRGILYGFQWVDKGKYLIVPEAFMRQSQRRENVLTEICSRLKDHCKNMFLANMVSLVKIDIDHNIERTKSLHNHSHNGKCESDKINKEICDNEVSTIPFTSDEAVQEIAEGFTAEEEAVISGSKIQELAIS